MFFIYDFRIAINYEHLFASYRTLTCYITTQNSPQGGGCPSSSTLPFPSTQPQRIRFCLKNYFLFLYLCIKVQILTCTQVQSPKIILFISIHIPIIGYFDMVTIDYIFLLFQPEIRDNCNGTWKCSIGQKRKWFASRNGNRLSRNWYTDLVTTIYYFYHY